MPAISLSKFKENLGNVVKPNRFYVIITPPQNITIDSEFLTFHTKSAKIPSRGVGEYEMKYYGMSLMLPGDSTHEDFQIGFVNDSEWKTRDFFESWLELIHNKKEMIRKNYNEASSQSTVEVQQLGDDGNPIAKYKYYHVFPKNMSEIELSMESSDTVEEFTVDFDYSYWKKE